MSDANSLLELPTLGVGLAYLSALHEPILASQDRLDFVELPTDTLLRRVGIATWEEWAAEIAAAFPVVCHGIRLGLGGPGPIRPGYLDAVRRLFDRLAPRWWSDHLDQATLGDGSGQELEHGIPIPFTADVAQTVAANIELAETTVGLPLLAENTWYDFRLDLPSCLPEPAFINAALGGHGWLLDVTNLWVNAQNYHFDPYAWLDAAPLGQAVQLHLAGDRQIAEGRRAGRWIDSHSEAIPECVWELAHYAVERAPVRAIVIERTNNLPPFEELLDEVERARELLAVRPVA